MFSDKTDLKRRRLVRLMGAAAMAVPFAMSGAAQAADDFPNRTITFICAFPAGSGADIQVRYFADKIGEIAGVSTIVDNKPGAGGTIASEYVARADPDGYTVYIHGGGSTAGNFHLWNNPAIDPREDLQGVSLISRQAFTIVVSADSPHQTIDDLNAFLLEAGEDATYATTATSGRVLAAAYINELGVNPVEVQYSTGPDAIPDITAGVVDFAAADSLFAMVNEREGRFRILATGASERFDSAPHVPTLIESGLDVDQTGWWAAWVPAGTDEAVVNQLNEYFREVLEMEETQEFMISMGGEVLYGTPELVQEMMVAEVDKWEYLVEIAGIPKN